MRRRELIAALLVAAAVGGCRGGTVRLAYRPPAGDVARYAITAEVASSLALTGAPARQTRRSVRLTATHTVVGRDSRGVRVRVALSVPGVPTRVLVVRLDRAAQLREVVAAGVTLPGELDDLGLSELFPPALGGPPDRPLRPGDRWRIAETIRLPGVDAARLTGAGELAELGTVAGRRVARVRSRTGLDVRRTGDTDGVRVELTGRQRTTATTAYDVDDGSVVVARSLTEGTFRVALVRPAAPGPPVTGSLRLTVRSDVRRTA